MKKYDFFIEAMKNRAHYKRAWMLQALSVVFSPASEVPWAIRHKNKRVEGFVPNQEGGYGWEEIEGCEYLEVPFVWSDATGPVKAGDVENLKKDLVNSTWGELLANSRILVYAAGDLIPYMEGVLHPERLEEYVVANLETAPKGGELEPGKFYVANLRRLGKAIGDLCGYDLLIPSIGIKALQAPPNNAELKKKLLEEHKDTLNDPVSQTKIQDELVKNYKEYYKGDASEGLFFKGKTVATALKRMFLIHGPESGFKEGGRATLITTTLDDGLNLDYFPDMANSLRGGSYSRGALTALAGTDVDLMGRNFQAALIQKGFCGTTQTVSTVVNKRHHLRWILKDGNRVQLDTDTLNAMIDQTVEMYDPGYCIQGVKDESNDVCEYCIGGRMAQYPTSIGASVQERLAFMMSAMMASAHAKQLKTNPLNLKTWLD